ncbi:hypothetical protein ACJX0J_009579, partial [Zea mays]
KNFACPGRHAIAVAYIDTLLPFLDSSKWLQSEWRIGVMQNVVLLLLNYYGVTCNPPDQNMFILSKREKQCRGGGNSVVLFVVL